MEIYSLYSKKIIETKIEQWKNLLSKSLEKDTLLDYHLELSNEAQDYISNDTRSFASFYHERF